MDDPDVLARGRRTAPGPTARRDPSPPAPVTLGRGTLAVVLGGCPWVIRPTGCLRVSGGPVTGDPLEGHTEAVESVRDFHLTGAPRTELLTA